MRGQEANVFNYFSFLCVYIWLNLWESPLAELGAHHAHMPVRIGGLAAKHNKTAAIHGHVQCMQLFALVLWA
jgi:hypothetical protein